MGETVDGFDVVEGVKVEEIVNRLRAHRFNVKVNRKAANLLAVSEIMAQTVEMVIVSDEMDSIEKEDALRTVLASFRSAERA